MSSPQPRRRICAGHSAAWNGSGAGCSSGSCAEAGRNTGPAAKLPGRAMADLLTRRASLLRFGGLLAAVAAGGWWKVRPSEGADAVACVLTPEQTEGPYYIPHERVRRNITDGHAGTPLTLRLAVVDTTTCRPIKGAAVDVWHADATGVYSGFGTGAGSRTFMRGEPADGREGHRRLPHRLSRV